MCPMGSMQFIWAATCAFSGMVGEVVQPRASMSWSMVVTMG